MTSFTYESGACACSRDKCSCDCVTYRKWNPKLATNADRIRAMTDEKLAEWLDERCDYAPPFGWLEWLRKEA